MFPDYGLKALQEEIRAGFFADMAVIFREMPAPPKCGTCGSGVFSGLGPPPVVCRDCAEEERHF
jgi:hypothetical protein